MDSLRGLFSWGVVILLSLILLLLSAQSYADVVLDCDQKYRLCRILIKGTIRQEDLTTLKKILNSVDKERPKIKTTRGEYSLSVSVTLDSSGGDVFTALAIGDLFYEYQFIVDVKSCSSSCVFILGSSIMRNVGAGEVYIHRPYSVATDRSYEQIKSDLANMERIAVSQFKRVGVSPDLWNAMMSVPPEKARRLSDEEIDYFGLDRNDPAYDDAFDSLRAKSLGITKQEYLRRKAISQRCIEQEASRGNYGSKIYFDCLKRAGIGYSDYPRQ
jgi:hypothetical protein